MTLRLLQGKGCYANKPPPRKEATGMVTKWTGIVLIFATGLIHLVRVPHHFEIAPTWGGCL